MRNGKLGIPPGVLNVNGMGGVLGPDAMGTFNARKPGASISTANLQSLVSASLAGRLTPAPPVAPTPPTNDQEPGKPGKQSPVVTQRRSD